jgi:hypothetical protein
MNHSLPHGEMFHSAQHDNEGRGIRWETAQHAVMLNEVKHLADIQ